MVSFCLSKSTRGTRFDTNLALLWTLIRCHCCCCCFRLLLRRGGTLLPRSNVSAILLFSWTLFFTALATPVSFPSKTTKRVFHLSVDGSYLFSYDTGPGMHQSFREETRNTKGRVSGSYGYVDPKGVLRITEYVADSKGYRASLEVYEPVHHFPSGPPLIVGPLPPTSERKEKKESVFDKYAFPIEPFESMKVPPAQTIDSNALLMEVKGGSNGSADHTSVAPRRDRNRGDTVTSSVVTEKTEESFNDMFLPTADISTLRDELQLLSLRLRSEPLLIIGPLPGEFEDVNELSFSTPLKDLPDSILSASKEIEANLLQEGARSLRSPVRSSPTKTNHVLSDDFGFRKVIPSLSDLNFVEKEMVQKGENLSSFASLPSSNLLQGDFVPLNQTQGKNFPSRRPVRIKKRKLNESEKLVEKLMFSDISNTSNASLAFESYENISSEDLLTKETVNDEKMMKLISFQTRNIFRELLKLNPRPDAAVPLKSIKISQSFKKRPKEFLRNSSNEESDLKKN